MKFTHSILATALLAGHLSYVHAQSKNTIETISITGANNPIAKPLVAGSVSIITSEQIKASGALSFTDLMRTIAGVNVSQSGAFGSLTELRFRGSESNHVMVLIDGVEINDTAQGGVVDFSHITMANIERIEVLRGPQSALWGSSAIAGIISIITKQGDSETLNPSLGLSVGDRDTLQANAGVSKKTEKLSYAISANVFKTAGENTSREGHEKDGYKNTSMLARMAYQLTQEHNLQVNARFVDYTSDYDATDFSTGLLADADNTSNGEHLSLGLNWHFTPSDNNNIYSQLLSLQYSEQSNDNYQSDIFSGSSKGSKLRLLWNNRFELGLNSWVNAGLETIREDFEQAGPIVFGDPNQKQSNSSYSFVSNGQYALSTKLNLSASLRYDNNDEFNNASSYRAGASYLLNNDWHVFLSYGKAIKNPTYTERFGYFPQTFLGNRDLNPEVQKSLEAGIEGNINNHSLQISWFNADLEDEILGFVFDANSGQFTAQNADEKSARQGIEFSLAGSIGVIDYKAQYSYLDAKQGNVIELRRARHTGSVSGIVNVSAKHSFYAQADYTGTRFDVFYAPFPAPSQVLPFDAYWLLSANYRYQHNDNLSLNLRLSNILNEQYEDVISFSGESSRALLNLEYSW